MRLKELKRTVEKSLGSEWFELEPETIKYELSLGPLDFDKLHILFCLENTPELFVNDGLFFLHCTDVLNDNVAQFDHIPFPTSLDLAWAIKEIEDASGEKLSFSNSVRHVVTYILKHEGYDNPTPFFNKYVEDGEFSGPLDRKKDEAIGLYLEGMTDGISN